MSLIPEVKCRRCGGSGRKRGQGDEAKFRSDMTSEAVKKKLNFDAELGNRVDIQGTPTFYLNGEKIDFSGAKGEDGFLAVFREKIDEAIK